MDILTHAEEDGRLRRGDTVIESGAEYLLDRSAQQQWRRVADGNAANRCRGWDPSIVDFIEPVKTDDGRPPAAGAEGPGPHWLA